MAKKFNDPCFGFALIGSVVAVSMVTGPSFAQSSDASNAAAALDDLLSDQPSDTDPGSDKSASELDALGAQTEIDDPAFNSAAGQTGDTAGPSELDALSRSADEQFSDMEERIDREPVSVTVRALNKVTAKYTDLSIGMNSIVPFGSLDIGAFHCDKRPPEDFPEVSAFLQVFDRSPEAAAAKAEDVPSGDDRDIEDVARNNDGEPDYSVDRTADAANAFELAADERKALGLSAESEANSALSAEDKMVFTLDEAASFDRDPNGRKIFSGWMFASSPALNPLEHPVYDVWVIDCETQVATASAEAPSNTRSAP
ncbi:MAG: DUF2155 domain-containing protein [Pseudomonadota bacterium]